MTKLPRGATVIALTATAALGTGVAPALALAGTPARTAPAGAAGGALGLPPLAAASRYNLAPASRTLRPTAILDATPVNSDFVTAASPTSEEDAHRLDADPTSLRTKVGGVTVRQAGGPNEPQAEFSYTLRAPRHGPLRLRIEEAGAEDSDYDVLVNGVVVRHRGSAPEQRGAYGGAVGLVHYDVKVPRAALERSRIARPSHGGHGAYRRLRVTFRNSDQPGHGARIAQVWAIAPGGRPPRAPFGGAVLDARGLLRSGGAGATISSELLGRPYVILDFGREVGGVVSVRARRLSGVPTLDFAFSESARFMTSASDFSTDPVGVVTETQSVKVGADTSTLRPPDLRGGFRYLMLSLRGTGAVRLSDLRLHFTAAPQQRDLRDYAGAFLSSDDQLNRFWYAGAYTVQLATVDPSTGRRYPAVVGPPHNDAKVAEGPSALVDGAKRDRFVWGGDLAIADPVAYLTTGDTRSPQASLDWLSKTPSPDGQPAGVYLPLSEGNGWSYNWGEYALWWIVNYETHWRYSGDRDFLDRWFSELQGDVAWAEGNVGDDGLLSMPGDAGGHWGYGDAGQETYLNALYVHALHRAADAAAAEGRDDLATTWRANADRTAAAINRLLWDPSVGAYVLKAGDGSHPQDANALAVLAGVATGDRRAAVLRYFKDTTWTPIGALTTDADGTVVPRYISPFVSSFELDAFAQGGRGDDAIELMRRTWGHMLQGDSTGTFWENVSAAGGPQLGSYTSYAHGWAAAPTSFLTNTTLGVTPTAGGYARFNVLPHPDGGLRWAEGTVPTPRGPIDAAWRRQGRTLALSVRAPAGTTYTAGVPLADGVVVRSGSIVLWREGEPRAPGVSADAGYVQIAGLTGAVTLTAEEAR